MEALTVEEVNQWKNEWLEKAHPLDWRVFFSKQDKIFRETNCESTAAAIRWKVSGPRPWKQLPLMVSVQDVFEFFDVFQIVFFKEDNFLVDLQNGHSDHILTIWHNQIVQSFYKHYEPHCRVLTADLKRAFTNVNDHLSDIWMLELKQQYPRYKLVFWIPN